MSGVSDRAVEGSEVVEKKHTYPPSEDRMREDMGRVSMQPTHDSEDAWAESPKPPNPYERR